MKLLLISFDATRFPSSSPLESVLENHRSVFKWSSPFRGSYYVKTEMGAEDFARTLDSLFENRAFLVSEVDGRASKTNGRAVREIWDFIKNKDQNL